jgi:hypothetical protein
MGGEQNRRERHVTHRTEIQARSPTCAAAVRAFAREISARTSLELRVEEAQAPADVEFAGETSDLRSLWIEWAPRRTPENEPAPGGEAAAALFDEDEETDEQDELPVLMIRHYARTLETLGRDEAVAAVVLLNAGNGGG